VIIQAIIWSHHLEYAQKIPTRRVPMNDVSEFRKAYKKSVDRLDTHQVLCRSRPL